MSHLTQKYNLRDVILSQSLITTLKKINLTQQKQTFPAIQNLHK